MRTLSRLFGSERVTATDRANENFALSRAWPRHNSTVGAMPCVDAWAESDSDGDGDRRAEGGRDHDATHVSDADAERRKVCRRRRSPRFLKGDQAAGSNEKVKTDAFARARRSITTRGISKD